MIVQISAGQGPAECQLAVAKLFAALQKEYGDLEEQKAVKRAVMIRFNFGRSMTLAALKVRYCGYAKVRSAKIIKGKTGMWM